MDGTAQFDPDRAFGGVARALGADSLARLRAATVVVVGVGGVGSWAVEALARTGVGHLRLIDMDHLAESNLNRQLPALSTTLGQAKVLALAQRIALINPQCQVEAVDCFLEPDNVAQLLCPPVDVVLDCTDTMRAKVAMAVHCTAQSIGFICCGGAGGKRDASRMRVDDLAHTSHDALLASLRSNLRKQHGFAKSGHMRIRCVSSDEPNSSRPASADAGLACAGYGSLVTVTATMGFVAAGAAITLLTESTSTPTA